MSGSSVSPPVAAVRTLQIIMGAMASAAARADRSNSQFASPARPARRQTAIDGWWRFSLFYAIDRDPVRIEDRPILRRTLPAQVPGPNGYPDVTVRVSKDGYAAPPALHRCGGSVRGNVGGATAGGCAPNTISLRSVPQSPLAKSAQTDLRRADRKPAGGQPNCCGCTT